MTRPRDLDTFCVCEHTGELAVNGQCVEHGGDACLIIVGWVGKDWPEFRDAKTGKEASSS